MSTRAVKNSMRGVSFSKRFDPSGASPLLKHSTTHIADNSTNTRTHCIPNPNANPFYTMSSASTGSGKRSADENDEQRPTKSKATGSQIGSDKVPARFGALHLPSALRAFFSCYVCVLSTVVWQFVASLASVQSGCTKFGRCLTHKCTFCTSYHDLK